MDRSAPYERGTNMLRSMYSGISGMKNFQTKLDVIGNNIANVNTFGFKKSRVTFKDMISQTVAGATAPNEDGTRGGINGKQVGLGSQIAAIDTVQTGGNMQTTGRMLDLAIAGDGYFVLQAEDGSERYTRAGNFYLDSEGYLVNSDGYFVVVDGDNLQIELEEVVDFSVGKDGTIYVTNNDNEVEGVGMIQLAKFPNADGLQKEGSNLFINTANSGEPIYNVDGDAIFGDVESGMLEMSNVDLSEEFTEMIVAQRGFQANTRIITTSDEILQELVNLKR